MNRCFRKFLSALLCFSIFLTANPLLATGFKFKSDAIEHTEGETPTQYYSRLKAHYTIEYLVEKAAEGELDWLKRAAASALFDDAYRHQARGKHDDCARSLNKIADLLDVREELSELILPQALAAHFEGSSGEDVIHWPSSRGLESLKDEEIDRFELAENDGAFELNAHLKSSKKETVLKSRGEKEEPKEIFFVHQNAPYYFKFDVEKDKNLRLHSLTTPNNLKVSASGWKVHLGEDKKSFSVVRSARANVEIEADSFHLVYGGISLDKGNFVCHAPTSIALGTHHKTRATSSIFIEDAGYLPLEHDYYYGNGSFMKIGGETHLLTKYLINYGCVVDAYGDMKMGGGYIHDYKGTIENYGRIRAHKNMWMMNGTLKNCQMRDYPKFKSISAMNGRLVNLDGTYGSVNMSDDPEITIGWDWYARIDEIILAPPPDKLDMHNISCSGNAYYSDYVSDGKTKLVINRASFIINKLPPVRESNDNPFNSSAFMGSFSFSTSGNSMGSLGFSSFGFSAILPTVSQGLIPTTSLLKGIPYFGLSRPVRSETIAFGMTRDTMALQVGDKLSIVERPQQTHMAGPIIRGAIAVGSAIAKTVVKNAKNAGRNKRLKELAKDDKLGTADRAWLQQEIKKDRGYIRTPPGKELAHPRGKEAAKGFDHSNSQLKDTANHRLQHKIDNGGRKNKIGCIKEGGNDGVSN